MFLPTLNSARRAAAAAAVAFLAAAAPALAQDAAPAASADQQESFTPEQLRLAQEAILASGSNETFDEILPTVAEQTKTVFLRTNPALAADIEEATTEVAIRMAQQRPALDRTVQEIWARRFTNEELQAIIDFYRSPAGSKLAKIGPDIVMLSAGAARQWGDRLSSEMITEVRAEMLKRGYDL